MRIFIRFDYNTKSFAHNNTIDQYKSLGIGCERSKDREIRASQWSVLSCSIQYHTSTSYFLLCSIAYKISWSSSLYPFILLPLCFTWYFLHKHTLWTSSSNFMISCYVAWGRWIRDPRYGSNIDFCLGKNDSKNQTLLNYPPYKHIQRGAREEQTFYVSTSTLLLSHWHFARSSEKNFIFLILPQ